MVIKLFDEDNNKHVYNVDKPIGNGSTGIVYKLSDELCLKYTPGYHMYDYSVLKRLRELDLANFYKIYTFLFDCNDDFSGYLMKYYQSEKINILTMPTEYTLANFYKLYNSVNKLSENEIVIRDMHDGNVIMNNNDITIIDADFYDEEYKKSIERIKKNNYISLVDLFSKLYHNDMSLNYNFGLEGYKVIFDLFSRGHEPNTIYEKLKEYKYPIDYVKCMVRKKQ